MKSCEGCGAPINPDLDHCPYCRRSYDKQNDQKTLLRHYDWCNGAMVCDCEPDLVAPGFVMVKK